MGIEEIEDKLIQIAHALETLERNGLGHRAKEILVRCKECLFGVPQIIKMHQYDLEENGIRSLTRKHDMLLARINQHLECSAKKAA